MTKISNQYSLTNILTADLANSRLGINNVSPAYSLDVTGTARVSTSAYFATASGNVGIGTTSPAEKLSVLASSGTNGYIFVSGGSGTTLGGLKFGNTTNTYGSLYFDNATNDVTLFQQYSSGNLIFGTNTTERMRITSGGNLLVGTTTGSSAVLHVGPTSTLDGAWISVGVSALVAKFSNTSNNPTTVRWNNYNNNFYDIQNNPSDNSYTIDYNDNERFRITSAGNILINTTTNQGRLSVNGTIVAFGTIGDNAILTGASNKNFGWFNDGTSLLLTYSGVANVGSFNMSTGGYTATSDINKKKDFEESNIGLKEILNIKPILYRMKTEDESSSKHLGFIAQEVKNYIPQAYTESGEFIGLTEMPIIAALTKAIQELSAEITILKNK